NADGRTRPARDRTRPFSAYRARMSALRCAAVRREGSAARDDTVMRSQGCQKVGVGDTCFHLRSHAVRRTRGCESNRPSEAALYSISFVAAKSIFGGIVTPSAFAVLSLITTSNLVACIPGSPAGFSPLRTRPV